ncbi:MAG: endopeptidase La [Desulfobacterales bacterium]|uniref:Lon protease n=1 Tax=Candidatus Desulfaltia bathyphila TaxID=2841697 RepID=A0A8J6N569_9BACT|nr:endopeptidase La [Candidatus Desulfaltia bathyphila]MBL7194679.1 endopeptidase La [Desulfobacterales bacterium]MBL7208133.1 endopeptidase La [Desulfobacterales bacterium]
MAESDKDDLISIIDGNVRDADIPAVLPLMPVRDVVIFNDMLLPLFVGREKSVRAVEEAVTKDSFLMLVTQKDPNVEAPKPSEIYRVGTVSRILRMLKLPDGSVKALVQGVSKARIVRYVKRKDLYLVKIEIIPENPVRKISLEVEAMMRNVRDYSKKILALRGELTGDVSSILESINDPGKLADLVASNLKLKIKESQTVLEHIDPVKRLNKTNDLLSREVELSSIQAKIQSDVRDEISKNQRDYFLREQMRAIHKELGEQDERKQEITDYKKRIKKAKMSKEAEKEAKRQLKRLEQMHPDSAEASVIRTYLDWLVDMPWSITTKDVINIKNAKKLLDADHYALDKVKDRVLEYLSVRKLNPESKGPILCFVGPPGVGKTSMGRSIANAMKRKFVRISLGGIRDEAEIRGHRRTYIGALPGRILQGLKQCGTKNPVFMMDEIDKLGADFRGDPSSALLEAFDPEQNFGFSDHYLNLPFDLSNVIFILTANLTDTIPSALLDRMEIISLSGYMEEEKRVIAQKYLLPRQIKENGLNPKTMSISTGALQQLIREYTSEAGLRNLEREIGNLCRKVARKIAEGKKEPFNITKSNLQKYMGVPKYLPEMDQENSQVGLSTGLAWTQAGGEVLYVEASLIRGKGDLIVTGQLGDVMQESARAAVTYARANLSLYKIKENLFENHDVHIHVPAGAIPKDGPSAGIAMATALISAMTNKPICKDVAMTGEITLRGRVLPVGGLKEKSLGALRAGIHTVILPEKNKKDLTEIPANVRRKIKFVPVSSMDEVLSIAIEKKKKSKQRTTK